MPPKTRVVIPCRRAGRTIGACLEALCDSSGIAFEVIVVDDGENGCLQHLRRRFGFTLRRTSGNSGAGAARNTGARDFTGDVLVFIDADVIVERNALRNLIEPIVNDKADATVGRYSEDIRGLRAAEAYKQLYLAYTYTKRGGYLADTFWTAIGAVRTSHFHAVGGFTDIYTGAGPEDVELGVRLTAHGSRILAVPSAAGQHRSDLTMSRLLHNDLRKGTEDVYLHWQRRVPLTHNRHAGPADIASVALSWMCVALAALCALWPLQGVLSLVALAYFVARRDLLLTGYARVSCRLLVVAAPLTVCLDLVRGIAVCTGTLTALVSWLSRGSIVPFQIVQPRSSAQ